MKGGDILSYDYRKLRGKIKELERQIDVVEKVYKKII